MKLIVLLLLIFFSFTQTFGQLPDKELTEEIIKEYLILSNESTKQHLDKIDLQKNKLQYKVGDIFKAPQTIKIMNHYTDSTILLMEDKESIIPKGYEVKIVQDEKYFYLLEGRNKKGTGIRKGYVDKELLTLYFFPENKMYEKTLYSDLRREDEKIKNLIIEKYQISTDQLDTIIENIRRLIKISNE
jgi:hypothetical protein